MNIINDYEFRTYFVTVHAFRAFFWRTQKTRYWNSGQTFGTQPELIFYFLFRGWYSNHKGTTNPCVYSWYLMTLSKPKTGRVQSHPGLEACIPGWLWTCMWNRYQKCITTLAAHSHFVRNEVCTKRSFYRTYVSNDVHISYRTIFVSYEGHSHFVRYEVRFCAVCVKIC